MERPVPLSLFAQFSNLQELVLVSQGLSTLKEVGSCRFLRKLVVTENKITSLEGKRMSRLLGRYPPWLDCCLRKIPRPRSLLEELKM